MGHRQAARTANLFLRHADGLAGTRALVRDRGTPPVHRRLRRDLQTKDRTYEDPQDTCTHPVANAFAERWIGTLRRELLDRTIIWNRRQLERLVVDYIDQFLRSQAAVACDFATIDTVTLRRFYLLFFIDIPTRTTTRTGPTVHSTSDHPSPPTLQTSQIDTSKRLVKTARCDRPRTHQRVPKCRLTRYDTVFGTHSQGPSSAAGTTAIPSRSR